MENQARIELTNLGYMTAKDIKEMVTKAKENSYYGLCVRYENVHLVAKEIFKQQAKLKIITVAGFPSYRLKLDFSKPPHVFQLGLYTYARRSIDEIRYMVNSEADEIDLVFPIWWYSRGNLVRITKFFSGIRALTDKPLKVICEVGTLFKGYQGLYEITNILNETGIDYFKTNTGLIKQDFSELVDIIKKVQEISHLPIKASGGIRTEEQVKILSNLGVSRIGTSSIQKGVGDVKDSY